MKQKFTEEQKRAFVTRFNNGESVSNLCLEKQTPRSTFYSWISKYKNADTSAKEPIYHKRINKLETQIIRQTQIIRVLQSIDCSPKAPLREKLYALEKIKDDFSVTILCEAINVDRGTFYNHILRNKKDDTWYQKRKEELSILITQIYDESNQIYGAKKIFTILKEQGVKVSEKYIRGVMKELGLQSIRTTSKKDYLKLNSKKRPDLLKRQFNATRPNMVWVSDTTCFKIEGRWYYICGVLDLYSRKVIAYKISPKHSVNLISGTFKMAYKERTPKDLIFHSDRGSQYIANSFTSLLKNLGIKQSFSPSGKPCHNAVMESFFATLKKEEIYRTNYNSFTHFKDRIAQYINFYNDKRPHSTLNNKTPNTHERLHFTKFCK